MEHPSIVGSGAAGRSPDRARTDGLIRVEDLHKVFATIGGEPVHAVRSATFAVHDAEFVSIVGPSGCGKSTILRAVAGLITPTSGRILISGNPVVGPRKGGTGIVFQSPLLLPWLTVLQNVLLPVEVLRLERRAYEGKAIELIDLVGLSGFAHRYPFELSGGMQQRVAIVRALVFDPPILLMDEPFAAVDAITRDQLNLELQRIWERYRKTVLFITHNIGEAVFLSDRVLVMSARPGTIVADISIDLPRPRTVEQMGDPVFARLAGVVRGQLFAHA